MDSARVRHNRQFDPYRTRRKSDLDEDREGLARQFLESRPKVSDPCDIPNKLSLRRTRGSSSSVDAPTSKYPLGGAHRFMSLEAIVSPHRFESAGPLVAATLSAEEDTGAAGSLETRVARARETLLSPKASTSTAWSMDSFRLISQIGNGAYGLAYKAVMLQDLGDVRKGDEVCVKVALESKCQDKQVFAEVRALNQARLLGTHPNVVRIMGYNTMVKPYFVVMELVYGWSLRREVAKRGPIPLDMIANWTKQILSGLQHLHGTKLLHRDLKSSNIMLDVRMNDTGLPYDYEEDSRTTDSAGSSGVDMPRTQLSRSDFTVIKAKIVDFGTSANLWRNGSPHMQREMGTLNWMPPEVMALKKSDAEVHYGTAIDIYTVGLVIYEMLSGLKPFHDCQKLQIALKVDTGLRPSLRGLACPPLLEWIIRYCLHADPSLRPSTAELLLLTPHIASCGSRLLSEAPRSLFVDALELPLPDDSAGARFLRRDDFTVGAFLNLRNKQEGLDSPASSRRSHSFTARETSQPVKVQGSLATLLGRIKQKAARGFTSER